MRTNSSSALYLRHSARNFTFFHLFCLLTMILWDRWFCHQWWWQNKISTTDFIVLCISYCSDLLSSLLSYLTLKVLKAEETNSDDTHQEIPHPHPHLIYQSNSPKIHFDDPYSLSNSTHKYIMRQQPVFETQTKSEGTNQRIHLSLPPLLTLAHSRTP